MDINLHVTADENGELVLAFEGSDVNDEEDYEDVDAEICSPEETAYGIEIISTMYNGTDVSGQCVEISAGEYVRSIEINYQLTDSDMDGVGDIFDMFPFDANETIDTDMDGVGDNADAFPDDPAEKDDSDGDGYGDNADVFPVDSSEWLDSD